MTSVQRSPKEDSPSKVKPELAELIREMITARRALKGRSPQGDHHSDQQKDRQLAVFLFTFFSAARQLSRRGGPVLLQPSPPLGWIIHGPREMSKHPERAFMFDVLCELRH